MSSFQKQALGSLFSIVWLILYESTLIFETPHIRTEVRLKDPSITNHHISDGQYKDGFGGMMNVVSSLTSGLVVTSLSESNRAMRATRHSVRCRCGTTLVPTPSPGVAWISAGNSFFSNKLSISTCIHLQSQYEPDLNAKRNSQVTKIR